MGVHVLLRGDIGNCRGRPALFLHQHLQATTVLPMKIFIETPSPVQESCLRRCSPYLHGMAMGNMQYSGGGGDGVVSAEAPDR